VSFKEGDSDWDLLGLINIAALPAIQWKLVNIAKMRPEKHVESLNTLKSKLGN